MQSTLLQSAETNRPLVRPVEIFMHLWPVHKNNETGRDSSCELELIASHTTDPGHLDPSCTACHRLRLQLQAIAQAVVRRVAPAMMDSIAFDIYADFASIICSPTAGPCVTVSIFINDKNGNDSTLNGCSDTVAQIKNALRTLGVRER